jgi:hypothetical protein
MDTLTLTNFVAERIRAGVAKAEIREELLAVGWSEEEAELAYRDGLVAIGVPVPNEGNRATLSRKSQAVDIVINFFSFILLGIVTTALGTLLFQIINKYLPDPLDATNWYSVSSMTSTIHYAIAALLIGFPLYYFAMRLWFRKFREDEGRTESKLSKWLTYLVLLITAVTIVGDLITVVFTMLQGEITARFFLKALTILVIAGAVFGFYYFERRKIQYHLDIPRSFFLNFGWGAGGLILTAVILGFVAGGSPTTERNRTFDRTRAEHLSSLANCIEQYAQNLGALPVTLSDLKQSSQYSYCTSSMQDPENQSAYNYRVVTASKNQGAARVGEFELCATFALASEVTPANRGTYYGNTSVWDTHTVGKNCHTLTAQLLIPTSQMVVPNYNYQEKGAPAVQVTPMTPIE